MVQLIPSKGLLALPLAGLICFAGAWTISAANPTQDPAPTERKGERQEHGEHKTRGERGEHAGRGESEHSDLEQNMKVLGRGMKAMRPMMGDFNANQATIIQTLAKMETSLIQSLSQSAPRPEKEMSESEWAQYQITFRQGIAASLTVILDMELAAHKGDAEAVVAHYRALNDKKKEGHDAFKLED